MLKSFYYKSIEWETKEPRSKVLEIRQKGMTKGDISIFTRQAGLIDHLMTKLAQINLARSTQSQSWHKALASRQPLHRESTTNSTDKETNVEPLCKVESRLLFGERSDSDSDSTRLLL